jgi:hypothetical protein
MYKLAISDTVSFKIKMSIVDNKATKVFVFGLTATRLSQDDITARFANKDEKTKDFVAEVVTDWEGQTLVLDADGKPAEYSSDALDAMLNVPGVSNLIFAAYLKECGAKEKN